MSLIAAKGIWNICVTILLILLYVLLAILAIVIIDVFLFPFLYKVHLDSKGDVEETVVHFRLHTLFNLVSVKLDNDSKGFSATVRLFFFKVIKLGEDEEKKDKKKKKKKKKEKKKVEIESLSDLIDLVKDKVYKAYRKIKAFLNIATSESLKRTVKLIFNSIKTAFLKIRPKHMEGHLNFGLSEPHYTGYALGLLSIMFTDPRYSEFRLEPDFNEKTFDTDLNAKGSFHIASLIHLFIKTALNKDFKRNKELIKKVSGR